MKNIILLVIALMQIEFTKSQGLKSPSEYGYQHLQIVFEGDPVDIIIETKRGEDVKRKPIILFGMGSTPRPLIMLDDDGRAFQAFPFFGDSIYNGFHIAVVNKPYVPIVYSQKDLVHNYYVDSTTGFAPKEFCERDYVDYYVRRNLKVIEYFKSIDWIDSSKVILAGHSASAMEMTLTAKESPDVTHLIYSGGNPFGRMINMIIHSRKNETLEKSYTHKNFERWESVVQNKDDNTCPKGGDSDKTTYDFSQNHMNELLSIKIPVLISYGTKDVASPFNDYLHLEAIKAGKSNFTFKSYIGLDHNYFEFNKDGKVNYDKYNWLEITLDWLKWVEKN